MPAATAWMRTPYIPYARWFGSTTATTFLLHHCCILPPSFSRTPVRTANMPALHCSRTVTGTFHVFHAVGSVLPLFGRSPCYLLPTAAFVRTAMRTPPRRVPPACNTSHYAFSSFLSITTTIHAVRSDTCCRTHHHHLFSTYLPDRSAIFFPLIHHMPFAVLTFYHYHHHSTHTYASYLLPLVFFSTVPHTTTNHLHLDVATGISWCRSGVPFISTHHHHYVLGLNRFLRYTFSTVPCTTANSLRIFVELRYHVLPPPFLPQHFACHHRFTCLGYNFGHIKGCHLPATCHLQLYYFVLGGRVYYHLPAATCTPPPPALLPSPYLILLVLRPRLPATCSCAQTFTLHSPHYCTKDLHLGVPYHLHLPAARSAMPLVDYTCHRHHLRLPAPLWFHFNLHARSTCARARCAPRPFLVRYLPVAPHAFRRHCRTATVSAPRTSGFSSRWRTPAFAVGYRLPLRYLCLRCWLVHGCLTCTITSAADSQTVITFARLRFVLNHTLQVRFCTPYLITALPHSASHFSPFSRYHAIPLLPVRSPLLSAPRF